MEPLLRSPQDIEALYEQEMSEFRRRIPESLALHARGREVMPSGVPATWMVGLCEHPHIFKDHGDGAWLVDGLDAIVARHGLPWSAFRLYCRSGICYAKALPLTALEASQRANFRLNRYQRPFMANRGVREAILTAGPAVPYVMTQQDVDHYLDVFGQMVQTIVAT
jgi:glutamate-1-semialdehyde aminotransferase